MAWRRSRRSWTNQMKGNPLAYAAGVALLMLLKTLFGIPVNLPWETPSYQRAPGPVAEGEHTVTRVVDGDTIHVEGHLIRLIGVDTPETKHPTKGVEPFGPEAADFTRQFVSSTGGRVYVQIDPQGATLDKYGRQLGYVWGAGYMLNEQLLLAGLARSLTDYRFDDGLKNRFRAAEEQARYQRRGIWSSGAQQPIYSNYR